jgi:hypothetical protein
MHDALDSKTRYLETYRDIYDDIDILHVVLDGYLLYVDRNTTDYMTCIVKNTDLKNLVYQEFQESNIPLLHPHY